MAKPWNIEEDAARFVAGVESALRKPEQCASCPYLLPSGYDSCPNCPERNVLREAREKSSHQPEYSGAGMVDIYRCSCGWESHPYFDGAPWALQEWEKHAKEAANAG